MPWKYPQKPWPVGFLAMNRSNPKRDIQAETVIEYFRNNLFESLRIPKEFMQDDKHLDKAIEAIDLVDFEEELELHKTYGGD